MSQRSSRSVLVVDDSAVVRLTITRRVRAAGRDVVEHGSARSAETVDPSTLSCALLDGDLGDGLGVDVAAHFREIASELPIAFFTSEATVAERAAAYGPVFAKPDELDLAIDWIERNSRG